MLFQFVIMFIYLSASFSRAPCLFLPPSLSTAASLSLSLSLYVSLSLSLLPKTFLIKKKKKHSTIYVQQSVTDDLPVSHNIFMYD